MSWYHDTSVVGMNISIVSIQKYQYKYTDETDKIHINIASLTRDRVYCSCSTFVTSFASIAHSARLNPTEPLEH